MMRAALGVLLLLAGCASPPALVALPAPSLAAGLLTAGDLPGFAYFDYRDPGPGEVSGCVPMSIPEPPDASTQFRAGDNGPYVHASLSLRSDTDARSAMDSARSVLRDCVTFTALTAEGQTVTVNVTPGVITGLGDDTVAIRFTSAAEGQPPFLSDQVIVRSGRLLIAVAHNNFQNVDTTITESAIRRAVSKAGTYR